MSEIRRFYLQERLGAGAFGEVFLAEQDSGAGFRRRVAIKLLNARAERMAEAGRRFRDEARILGRLSHKHIVTVLDLVRLDDRWAVVMDYVPGADLDRVLIALEKAGESFPPAAALEVGVAVLSALDAAYHADDGNGNQLMVVHRDIKPSNILLTSDAELKVLDFGIARVNLETRESMTVNATMGTERYMAPERILGEGDLPAGDVYATITSVVELILGEPMGRTPVLEDRHVPFVEEVLDRVTIVLGSSDTATEVVEWFRRALATEPEDRPPPRELGLELARLARRLPGESMVEFAARFVPEIEGLLGKVGETVDGVLTVNPLTSGPPHATLNQAVETDDTSEVPASRRRTGALIGVVAALVLVLGAATAMVVVGGAVLFAKRNVEPDPVVIVEPPEPPPDAPDMTPAEPPVHVPSTPSLLDIPPEPEPVVEKEPTRPRAHVPTESAPKPIAEDAPRVGSAKVVLTDASSLEVVCGDVTSSGTASVILRQFPAGKCVVTAKYLGKTLTDDITLERKRQVSCTVAGDTLTCD
jgi:serine/threonine-protein kinase